MFRWLFNSVLLLAFCLNGFAQNVPDSLKISKKDSVFVFEDKTSILAPSKAAFYSAVLPGLGQVYNKKYWKVPLVYAAIGTGVYFYVDNNNLYNEFRTAYKNRKAGRPDIYNGNFEKPYLSDDALIRAQNVLKKNKDLSLFVTIGLYILNIVEANVDAHLPDKKLDTNISFRPASSIIPQTGQQVYGATISFNF